MALLMTFLKPKESSRKQLQIARETFVMESLLVKLQPLY